MCRGLPLSHHPRLSGSLVEKWPGLVVDNVVRCASGTCRGWLMRVRVRAKVGLRGWGWVMNLEVKIKEWGHTGRTSVDGDFVRVAAE